MQDILAEAKIHELQKLHELEIRLECDKSELRTLLIIKEIDILKVKGLLNARSIFELCIRRAGWELKCTKGLVVTTTCNKIGELIEKNKIPDNDLYFTKLVYEAAVECGCKGKNELSTMYASLSREIHGYPWYETAVRIYADELSSREACIITKMCDRLYLETELIRTPSAPIFDS